MLIDKEIRNLIFTKEMIQGYVDLETQLQPNGFDLTINEVMEFSDVFKPRIDFTNQTRLISLTIPVLPEGREYRLDPGRPGPAAHNIQGHNRKASFQRAQPP